MVEQNMCHSIYLNASAEGKRIINEFCMQRNGLYGDFSIYRFWDSLTERHKSDIPKVIELYHAFCDLYNNHYEDLLLYSKMYRDHSPWFVMDIWSYLYFGFKKDEIIGYKKHLKDLSTSSLRAKVALLYINNENDFKEFCKRLGIDKLGETLIDTSTDDKFLKFTPIEYYEFIIDKGFYKYNYFSVCNLTDEQCEIILNEQATLLNTFNQEESKENLYNKYYQRLSVKNRKTYGIYINERKELIVSERDLIQICLFPTLMDIEYRSEQAKIREQEKEEKEKKRIEEERKRKEREEQHFLKYGFNKRNKHTRDERLSFNDSTHIYTVNGRIFDSVTTIVENAFPKFDSEKHAKRVAERDGLTISQVLKAWEEKGKISREAGTKMHQQIERFLTGLSYERTPEFSQFKYFYDQITLHPYRTEWAIFDEDSRIAGTVDYVDDENGYVLYDWKRSTSILKNGLPDKSNAFGEKGNYPIEHLDNCAYYHYALQLSFYRYILEKNYGITIKKQRLGVFHSSYNKPYILEMPYLKQEVESIIGLRSEIIL